MEEIKASINKKEFVQILQNMIKSNLSRFIDAGQFYFDSFDMVKEDSISEYCAQAYSMGMTTCFRLCSRVYLPFLGLTEADIDSIEEDPLIFYEKDRVIHKEILEMIEKEEEYLKDKIEDFIERVQKGLNDSEKQQQETA